MSANREEELEIVRIIYERGIAISKRGDTWYLLNIPQGKSIPVDIRVRDSLAIYKPIVATRMINTIEENSLLDLNGVTIGEKENLDVKILLSDDRLLQNLLQIRYARQNICYHCIQLAKHYFIKCQAAVSASYWKDLPSDKVIGTSCDEAFYEFDALITSIRRAYDYLRFPLWRYFGPSNDTSTPRAFYKALPSCNSLPKDIEQRLNQSWQDYGEKLTEYRDCMLHNVPVGMLGLGSVHMKVLEVGSIGLTALIPDNPSGKSNRNFIYRNGLDALTYGWRAANEIIQVENILWSAINIKLLSDSKND